MSVPGYQRFRGIMKLETKKLPLADFAAGLLIVVLLIASPANSQDSASGPSVYKSKCTTCHGPDGGGTAVGKSLKAADLRSPEVQSKSDAELTQVISDGKGNMPGFKGTITDEEIHAVLAHVRTLAAKKK
jgi:mono/diheme cytochrome c family protein